MLGLKEYKTNFKKLKKYKKLKTNFKLKHMLINIYCENLDNLSSILK